MEQPFQPFEDILQCHIDYNSLEDWIRVLQKIMHVLNQSLVGSMIYSTASIHMSGNKGVEMGKVPLILISCDPLVEIFLPVPTTLSSSGLEVLVPV